jgi:hypothetical protein
MFLWRLFLEAKLRKIDHDVVRGVPTALAFMDVGLTEVHLHQMARHAKGDLKFESLVSRAQCLVNS